MEYKILERDAKLGDYSAAKKLEQRQIKLETLPIRDAFGYSLTWCPEAVPQELVDDINKMYNNISVTDVDTDISIEKESFHSCRIEGADTPLDELFDIFRAKRTESKGDKMILNTYRAVKFLNLTARRNIDTLVKLWEIVTDGVCDNPGLSGSKFRTGVVMVGTHQAPDVEFLDYCMKQFFSFYNGENVECPYIKVAIIHFYFVYMHPFCDGNGRIARLLTSDFLIHSGLNNFSALTLSKTINETAPEYYQALENSENSLHDVTPFIQYMLKTVYDNLYEVLEGQGRYVVNHTDWGEKVRMNKWKKKLTKKERGIYASVISVFFVVLSVLFTYLKPLNTLDYIVSDFFYQYLAEKKESDSNIKIIAIDNKTVSRIGKFEKWSRSQTARLINYLNSGKNEPDVIALGLDYHNSKDMQGDISLIEACKEYGNVCISSVVELESGNNKKKSGSSSVLYVPSSLPDASTLPVSANTTAQYSGIQLMEDSVLTNNSQNSETGLPAIPAGTVSGQKIKDIIMPFDGLIPYVTTGIINISKSDYNGDVRGMVASVGHKGKEYDSFPLAVYKMYLKENGKKFRAPDTGPDNSFGINYSKNKKNYEVYSFYDVICGSVDKSKFNNSIVLISDYTTSSTFSIPNYKSLKLSEIELQANVINALLHNNTIHYASRWFLALWYSIFAVIFFLVTFHSSGLGTIFYSIGIIAFQILACCMTNVWGYYIPLLRIVMLIIIIAIVNFIVSYIVIKKQQYTMEKVFKKYVDEQVVNEIKEGGFDVSIGGTRKDIAVLFVDIRGFTPLSEKLSPENVVDILNSYLTIIANAVAANGGTLDKFIGDAAMAVFNSPSDLEDYVFRAVCTAWDILSNEENLRKECLEKYGREVEFGIGINCGDAVIGNIGSQNRMEYTAIGDTVNTTSRLEGVAGPGQILISREVAKRLGSRIDVSFAGEYSLKGKKRKVVAYEVNGILEQYEPVVKRDKTISEIYEDSIKEIKKVQEKCITNVQAIKELAGKEKGGIKEAGGKGIEIWGNKDHKTASIAKGGK